MHSQHSVTFSRGVPCTCSCIRRSDREQCLPFKVGAQRGTRLIGLFGRVIAAIVAAAVKEEDFALACVGCRFGAIASAEILPVCERSQSE